MSFSCPKCTSENTQKLSIVYRSGTSAVDLKTAGVGAGSGGGALGAAATTGTTQSDLAKIYGPPVKMAYLGPAFGIFVLGSIISLFAGSWLMLVTLALIGGYWYAAFKHNGTEYPWLFANWDGKFLCLRCENTFNPTIQAQSSSSEIS